MIQSFKAWLNKPYYLIDDIYVKTSMTFGVGIFTCFFLFVFKPFGIDKVIEINPWLILGYGVLVSMSLYVSYFVLPKRSPVYFNIKNWTIQREATFLFITFIIISTSNFFYHNTYISEYMPAFNYAKFMLIVFSIGIFPVFFIIFMVERHLNKKLNTSSNKIVEELRKETITIKSENIKEEPLIVDIGDFLYAKSENNYTTFSYLKNDVIQNDLLRISLKKTEILLSSHSQFLRCHRSYLINKNNVIKIDANAKNPQLFVKNTTEAIPISRSFPISKLTL